MGARGRLVCAIAAVALAVPLAATASRAELTPAGAVAGLNAMRAANGIPGHVTLNARWSKACSLHNAYQTRNKAYGHFEVRSKPGYTADGAWAAQHSLIRIGQVSSTWDGFGPFTDFPYHLFPLLAPQFAVTGFDATANVACIIINGQGAWRNSVPKASSIYTVPRNGATGVRASFKDVAEFPLTPAGDAGLRPDATTGPNLFVYADGPWARCGRQWCSPITILAASLAPAGKPSAKVQVRWTKRSQFPYPSQILVPVSPLAAATKYTASVRIRSGKTVRSHTWSFTTA